MEAPVTADIDKDTNRGAGGFRAKDTNRGAIGSSAGVANDLFQRASQLGGLLIVAFVAPVGPTAVSNGNDSTRRALLGISSDAERDRRLDSGPVQSAVAPPKASRSISARQAMIKGLTQSAGS
jgi:hypothetical protein